jgi:MFS family permease
MSDPSLTEHSSWYLNMPFWWLRVVIYFVAWLGLAYLLNKKSAVQDEPVGRQPRFQLLSGLGILIYALTISFAAVDWVMSLDPHWGSTIYGMIFMTGQGLSALAFSIIMLTVLTRYSPMREIIKAEQFHDIAKLMLAFVMLFAYTSFSQWLIIWSGNLPEEISFYLARIHGGWGVVALAIILFHFALPFALLLSRSLKRDGRKMIGLALLLMFMRLVDIYWYVVPNFAHARGHFYFSPWYLVAPIALGGLWLGFFFYNLRRRPILPLYEPQMPSLLHQGSGHGH